MPYVLAHLSTYRGVLLRERPVEEARKVSASLMRLSYSIYDKEGRRIDEGAVEDVMVVDVRGRVRYSPSISGEIMLSCEVEEGRITRHGSLVVIE